MPDPLPIPAPHFADVPAVVEALRPEYPIFCVRPHALRAAARRFLDGFPGRVLYALKCNSDPAFVGPLHEAGIVDFDVASLAEIEQVSALDPPGRGYFMHPVKSRRDIAAAYRILLEAGGGASDAEGRSIEDFPLTVDRRTSLFAWGDHAMAEATLAAGKR